MVIGLSFFYYAQLTVTVPEVDPDPGGSTRPMGSLVVAAADVFDVRGCDITCQMSL